MSCSLFLLESILKTALFINFKNYFSKLLFEFFLALSSCLSLMTLCAFFNILNNVFNTCFKFLICIIYSFFYPASFSTFSMFILSGKKGKLLWRSCDVLGYWTLYLRIYPSSLCHAIQLTFHKTFTKLSFIFSRFNTT